MEQASTLDDIEGRARARDLEAQREREEQHAEQAKKSPYRSFTQFNDKQLGAIRRMTADNPVAASVFFFLVEHMSTNNAVVAPYSLLMKVTGKSRMTVYRAVEYLRKYRFIDTKKIGSGTVYHMNCAVVWHSHGENVKYAELNAAVLLDPDENPSLKKFQKDRVNHIQLDMGF